MTLEELKKTLDIYGGDLNKWPPPLRDSAEELLATSTQAQDLLSDATNLDILIRPDHPRAAPDLAGRIVSRAKDE